MKPNTSLSKVITEDVFQLFISYLLRLQFIFQFRPFSHFLV